MPPTRKAKKPEAALSPTITTTMHISREHFNLLREVALARAKVMGGRPSVSAIITELVEVNRARLEREKQR